MVCDYVHSDGTCQKENIECTDVMSLQFLLRFLHPPKMSSLPVPRILHLLCSLPLFVAPPYQRMSYARGMYVPTIQVFRFSVSSLIRFLSNIETNVCTDPTSRLGELRGKVADGVTQFLGLKHAAIQTRFASADLISEYGPGCTNVTRYGYDSMPVF
jgi:hypothetical protein